MVGSLLVIYMDGQLDLAYVAEIAGDFLVSPSVRSIEIDLSGLIEIEWTGARFLLFIQEEAAARGKSCRFSNASDAVVAKFRSNEDRR